MRQRARSNRQRVPDRRADAAPGPAVADTILDLQRRVGNRVVARLVTQPPPMPLTNDPMAGTTSGDLAPPEPRPQLRWGSNGPAVELLQGRLNQDRVDLPLEVDGSFRQHTDNAVREFQRRHGLLVDGIVGPQTWGMLDELARAGIAGPHDVLEDTRAVTAEEAAAIAESMGTDPPAGEPMVVAGFEAAIVAALDEYYEREQRQLVGSDITSLDHVRTIGRIAQRLVDDFYSDHVLMASRAHDLGSFHPGSHPLPIEDAAGRDVDREFARAWVELDMLPRRGERDAEEPRGPSDVALDHHVDTRRTADRREVRRVADRYLRRGGLERVVRHIRSYPAEVGTGTAFIGLRSRSWLGEGTRSFEPQARRRGMWDMLSGLMHEYIHQLAHPHYSEAAEAMGGRPRRVLIEGMCDHFRTQAWDALMPRFLTDDALRAEVEGEHGRAADGTTLPLDPDVIVPHDTYDELADAQAIVQALGGDRRAEANVRAAYFMGHVDLIGIAPTSAGEHPAGSLGTWHADDAATQDLYVVAPGGETLGTVMERTGSTSVRDENGLGLAGLETRLAGGTRLRVRGIRHVRSVLHDSRAQVASQNGVTQAALERANRWSHARGDTAIPPGIRILIPAH
jgi:Putative peptidoglycan binding domain